jgi:hypothetical protein
LPGLTRQSILFEKCFFAMDARVKPAHDERRMAETSPAMTNGMNPVDS